MTFFKEMTTGNSVIMGRKTYESLGRCLPNRYNIVLSHQFRFFGDSTGCVLRYGVDEALMEAEQSPKKFSEIFVIGGAVTYEQFAPLVDRYLITVINKSVLDGDAFFDLGILKNPKQWEVRKLVDLQQREGDEAEFEIFELNAVNLDQRVAMRAEIVANLQNRLSAKPRASSSQGSRSETIQTAFAFG